MLLLITGSIDGTSDRIIAKYGEGVFRLNYDLWRDYSFSFTPAGWEIVSPSGLRISSETVSAAYWWKAFAYYQTGDDNLISAEVRYMFRDLYGWCVDRGIARGNSVGYHDRFGKMTILGLARDYFRVPHTLVALQGHRIEEFQTSNVVAKSLSSEISSDDTVLMTTAVDLGSIDTSFPWYLQDKVESQWDVTVFFCNGSVFPFRRSREKLSGLDWRLDQKFDLEEKEWFPFEMKERDNCALRELSARLGIEFGRYDFMIDERGDLQFLEMNANGQWVFLDVHDEYGLLDCVVEWLKR